MPWVRAHTLSHLPHPLDPQLRSHVAANIRNRYGKSAAVQAAALTAAKKSPSPDFIEACQEAIAENDQWIKPMAQAALKACRDAENKG